MPTTHDFVSTLHDVLRTVHTADLREIELRLNRQHGNEGMFSAHDLADWLLRIVKGEEDW